MQPQNVQLDDRVARRFLLAAILWGALSLVAGLLLATELLWWQSNLSAHLAFGRLRPIHTNTGVFAFVGNLAFAGIYYSAQRMLVVRLPSPRLAAAHFWTWQLAVAAGAVTLALGATQGKEYAEFEWPIDLVLASSLVIFAVHFAQFVAVRRVERLHVGAWFYLASIALFPLAFVAGNLALPLSPLESYSLLGGAADAAVQWWYGESVITLLMTLPALGLLYYFLPAAAQTPVHSHRLAVIHFWSLLVLSLWAGPRYLLNTALPESAQVLGVAATLAIAAPALGGVLNLALCYRGIGARIRTEPALKFFLGALVSYTLIAVEGTVLSLRPVSAVLHGTDWAVGHSHAATMGFGGFVVSGVCYYLVPRLYGAELRSKRAAHIHFYLATLGLILYTLSMWIAGATEGAMLASQTHDGGLTYPSFVDTLRAVRALHIARLVGGVLFVAGFAVGAWNLWATARAGGETDSTIVEPTDLWQRPRAGAVIFSSPVASTVGLLGLLVAALFVNSLAATALVLVALTLGLLGVFAAALSTSRSRWHAMVEAHVGAFAGLLIVALIGATALQIGPVVAATLDNRQAAPAYTALEIEGRAIYVREGCHSCHTQMVRPFLWETTRYGEVSLAGDSADDHPFQWGSRRVGPDLARVGRRYSPGWHYSHTLDPRSTNSDSNMPPYPHLATKDIDFDRTGDRLRALARLGIPYQDAQIATAARDARGQAQIIAAAIASEVGAEIEPERQLIALIAYLERLGEKPSAEEESSD